jgi:tetratricopeptide (TPR) repeat protein
MAVQIGEATSSRAKRASRRRRRVVWTAALLAGAGMIGGLIAWKIQRDNRPEEYEPGEASADITHSVEEEHRAREPFPRPAAPLETPIERRTDALRDAGRPLPGGAFQPRFTDVTEEAGLAGFRSFAGARTSQLPEDMGSGAAWGDFDNDGFDDLFLVSAGGPLNAPESGRAPSMLFRNRRNGTFEAVSEFPEVRILGMGAAWGDYDNDGWLDLVVTGVDTILLFRNHHGRLLSDKALPSPKGFWTGASWGDFDNDGDPDLYVCGYVRYKLAGVRPETSRQFGLEVPYTLNPSSFEPERNLLFRNNGNGTFTEVAAQLGVGNPDGRSLSALWHDFDGDGWLDLYVANDISESKLYLNRRGSFEDAGKAAWVSEYRGSMGLAAGDFDRDGDDDLFISHWIAQQYALYQSLLRDGGKAPKSGPGGPSELHFHDVAEMRGIGLASMQSIGWGAAFADFDSDGWPDLVVANGSTFETKDGTRGLEPMPSFLFWNDRGRYFRDLAPWNKSLATPHVSRGLAVADYDNDGAMDVLLVDLGRGVRLLRNDVPHGNWVEFRLRSRVGRDRKAVGFGDGATVVAWVEGVPLRRTVSSASYLSQDSRRVHIGIGQARTVDRLEVRWLGGRVETWDNVAANRIWEVVEGNPPIKPFRAESSGAKPSLAGKRLAEFWEKQRAAMDAMKRRGEAREAVRLFREALVLDPTHEDSRYYLANCLAAQGDVSAAIAELGELARINPQSHRAFARRGALLAASATSVSQLDAAEVSLNEALRITQEETGTLMLLGETALARGNLVQAEERLELVCRANPRALGALFLRAYVKWSRGDGRGARSLLSAAADARGKDWKPRGSVSEGDVRARMFAEAGFLSPFWDSWDGSTDPSCAFRALGGFLSTRYVATTTR